MATYRKLYKGEDSIPLKIRNEFNVPYNNDYTVEHYYMSGVIFIKKDGRIHNSYGPASYSLVTGILAWYKNDRAHRIGGPAIIDTTKGTVSVYYEGHLMNEKFIGKEAAKELVRKEMNANVNSKEKNTESSEEKNPDQKSDLEE